MSQMSSEERRVAILSMLERNASVQVGQLADAFGVSRVTARADLDALERDGKLRRTHGGATSLSRTLTVSVQDKRVNVNVDAKRAIARRAATLVDDGDSWSTPGRRRLSSSGRSRDEPPLRWSQTILPLPTSLIDRCRRLT